MKRGQSLVQSVLDRQVKSKREQAGHSSAVTVGPSARVDAILPKTLKWKGGLDSKVMTMDLRKIKLSMSWLVSGAGQIGQPLTTLAKGGSSFVRAEDNQ